MQRFACPGTLSSVSVISAESIVEVLQYHQPNNLRRGPAPRRAEDE